MSSLLGAEEAAGGRTLRRPARETWGHLHPPLRWTPHLNGSTRTGTTSGGRKKKQQRSLVSRSACKNMNIGYKDKTPSAYLKIRAAQTGIVTVYKKGAQTSRYLSTITEKQVMTSKGSSCIQVKNAHSDGFRSIFAVT